MARRFVVMEIAWCEETSLSNWREMRAGAPTVAGVTSTMWPKTLLPSFIFTPVERGTSCIILPVTTWSFLHFAEERFEFKRTGSIVPRGMTGLLSGGVWSSGALEWTNAGNSTREGLGPSCGFRSWELACCTNSVAHKSVPAIRHSFCIVKWAKPLLLILKSYSNSALHAVESIEDESPEGLLPLQNT